MRAKWLAAMAAALTAFARQRGRRNPRRPRRSRRRARRWRQDAAGYARRYGVTLGRSGGAVARAAGERGVHRPASGRPFASGWSGFRSSIAPALRIVVLLTGTAPVADTSIAVEGMVMPVHVPHRRRGERRRCHPRDAPARARARRLAAQCARHGARPAHRRTGDPGPRGRCGAARPGRDPRPGRGADRGQGALRPGRSRGRRICRWRAARGSRASIRPTASVMPAPPVSR